MKQILLCVFSFVLTATVNAQTIKKYSGQMSEPVWIAEFFEFANRDINGYYSYYEDERENRIIHGDFFISYDASIYKLRPEIHGSFRHGKRDGKWIIRAKSRDGKYVNNYLYQFEYSDGVLNGPFNFHNAVIGSGIEIVGHFVNGLIAGKVTIKQHWDHGEKGFTLVEGNVNKKGNPHGIWTEKDVWGKAIPKEITRLYYDGNLVYRREKDLSSGRIVYTYSAFDEIRTPADITKIFDTIINGKECVKVGKKICSKEKTPSPNILRRELRDDIDSNDRGVLYWVTVLNCPMIEKVYPSIISWRTFFDKKSIDQFMQEQKRKMEEEKRRREEEQRRLEEQAREKRLKEERILKEKAAEEERIRLEKQRAAELKAKGLSEWEKYHAYYISIFDDSVNFMNHLEAVDWENYAKSVIEDEYDGLVYDLSNDIVDRSAKGYKKEMDTLQVSYVFSSLANYNSARKLGRERVTKDILSYANNIEMAQKAERKAIQKEKNKKTWKTVRNVTMGVALVAVVVVLKYMDSASAN